MQVTIKEIARRLGVNPSTVSRALAGKPDVSKVTRQKVIELASQLNYTPNLWAQNLVGTASNWIGCLVLDLSNPFYVPLIRALEDIAGQNGYMIFLGESRRQLQTERAIIERFRRIKAAGVILSPVLKDLSHLQVLREENVPMVIVGRTVPGFDSVNVDNYRSGYLVGQYLLSLGHRRIGFLYSGDPYNTPEGERLRGFKAALAELPENLSWEIVVGNNEITGGELGAQKWWSDSNRPSAVFCSNDMLAMGFITLVTQMGASVPEDISVVGHDNIPFAGIFKIPLTTVAFSTDQMGQKAMEILLARMLSGNCCNSPQTILLEPEIVMRSSCTAR
jgi:DNA-binding LacI/PurR family transcriptional regulator